MNTFYIKDIFSYLKFEKIKNNSKFIYLKI
uniref:Uncharacterized protein n=1 Tax=viral metagenome TaxID=1070528 RepID=A0A6C0ADT3_9ZZZZ